MACELMKDKQLLTISPHEATEFVHCPPRDTLAWEHPRVPLRQVCLHQGPINPTVMCVRFASPEANQSKSQQ